MNDLLKRLQGGLVVSCQAYPGEPMLDPRTMTQVALAAVAGGAVGIRAKGLDDLRSMRPEIEIPLIGAAWAAFAAAGFNPNEIEEGT